MFHYHSSVIPRFGIKSILFAFRTAMAMSVFVVHLFQDMFDVLI